MPGSFRQRVKPLRDRRGSSTAGEGARPKDVAPPVDSLENGDGGGEGSGLGEVGHCTPCLVHQLGNLERHGAFEQRPGVALIPAVESCLAARLVGAVTVVVTPAAGASSYLGCETLRGSSPCAGEGPVCEPAQAVALMVR